MVKTRCGFGLKYEIHNGDYIIYKGHGDFELCLQYLNEFSIEEYLRLGKREVKEDE